MPYDVLIAYVALDTLSRNGNLNDIREFLKRQSYNDTIKYIYKYYYKVVDYDPIKFFLSMKYYGVLVTTPQTLIENEIIETVKRVSPNVSLDYALLKSSIIAKIHVIDTNSIIDTNAKYQGKYIQIVNSLILDTIKGKVTPTCKTVEQIKIDSDYKNKYTKTLSVQADCLQFNYCLDWTRGGTYGPTLRDNLGNPWIKPNQDYIVFLSLVLECDDSTGVYYCLRPTWPESYTFRMYPINNGIVYDPKNEFGFGLSISSEEFIEKLKIRIEQIKNFGQ